MPWAARGEKLYEGEMMRCGLRDLYIDCQNDAVAYFMRGEHRVLICPVNLKKYQRWYGGQMEIAPIGNLLHPDPAIAWQEKHAAANLEPTP